jgi:hypothetical protein
MKLFKLTIIVLFLVASVTCRVVTTMKPDGGGVQYCNGFDSALLIKQMEEEREVFPLITDAEQSIIFNRVAYLLDDNGNTIEKIQS